MSGAVGKANKPQLRGLLHSQIKVNILLASVVAVGAALGQYFFVNNERKRVYAEFYKNYDIEKAFNTIRNKGLFDSCEPDN
ncbi:hypothetical protein NQ314_015838 [Rhamnusium bicolor]|uniref:Mitochondrial cytochrome c oxidase subunit VIc/VIIs domain-containing protein n=1 Tax=Rhamnusium bicolor TaxID=1586634 RepID=A0AAV8WYI0_9CUCU|nr:hypothetical protein NQ314_015838 [Rhamnusium bicolor]